MQSAKHHSFQVPKGVTFSLDLSLPAQIVPMMRKALPAQDGMFYRFRLSPIMKLSNTMRIAPVRPSKKGLYRSSRLSLYNVHTEYDRRSIHNGTK